MDHNPVDTPPSTLSRPFADKYCTPKPSPKPRLQPGMVVAFSISMEGTADLLSRYPLVGEKLQGLKPKKYIGVVGMTRPFNRPELAFEKDVGQYRKLQYVQIMPIGASPPDRLFWQNSCDESTPSWCIPLVNPTSPYASHDQSKIALSKESKPLIRSTLHVYTLGIRIGLVEPF